MSFSERIRSEEDFVREYELRRRYLEWLRSMAAADPRYLKPEFLVVEFEKFYANPRYFESITPPEVPRPKVEATSTGAAFADSSVKLVRWGKRELGSTVRVIDVRKGAGEGTVAIVERKAKKKKGGRKDRKLLRLRRE
jgi:hypothetical protein